MEARAAANTHVSKSFGDFLAHRDDVGEDRDDLHGDLKMVVAL